MFCYSENENLSRRFSGSFDPSSFDSNRAISTHLQNYFFLKFILQKSDDNTSLSFTGISMSCKPCADPDC